MFVDKDIAQDQEYHQAMMYNFWEEKSKMLEEELNYWKNSNEEWKGLYFKLESILNKLLKS